MTDKEWKLNLFVVLSIDSNTNCSKILSNTVIKEGLSLLHYMSAIFNLHAKYIQYMLECITNFL